MVKWRVDGKWYAIAIGLPVGAQLLSILVNPMFGSASPVWSNVATLADIAPMVGLYAIFSGPVGEEPGWSGFAVPRLLAKHSALTGSIILGVVWAVWHFPLGLMGDLSVYGTLNVLLAAIVFTWLYQNTGSIFLAILMHTAHQNSIRFLGKVIFADGDFVQQQWLALAVWAVIAVGIVMTYGTASFTRRQVLPHAVATPA